MKDTSPYFTPPSGHKQDLTDGALLRRVRLVTALIIPLAIVGGVFMTVIGMMRSFDALAKAESVEPSQLAGDISTSLSIGAISIPIAIVAFAIWLWATLRLRKIERAATNGLIE
ncbi:MotA/TolQ/ExbB proton channel family protein [Crateriforma conspicua]|uniref:MotA/TolQ/ExbB proton channel family protein n=1 Tax=Crateriforma conspicua TaxID=2527996 RepID=A0A5C5YED4_9PLAN|nr:MotA/TolQ/ExbB proton channel family protein [Crateriforma conspicua]TWT72665.1 MotA/TolQ/ExbB proton channel family protein [Crateriforma conspicua]